MNRRHACLGAAAALPLWAHAQSSAPIANGSGATFPAKVYAMWAERYARDTGSHIAYKPSGSSAGVKQMVERSVDFSGTDVPLNQADLDKHQLFQFPTLVGGIVPVVNLPGVASGRLRLSAEVLAGIFAGDISRWSDRAITALNPALTLPDTRITRVVRADGSGSTEVFVSYLKKAGPGAAAGIVGLGGKAQWPGTVSAVEGSSKLVDAVTATPGAIGYVSSDYALRDQATTVQLRNARGEWVSASVESFKTVILASHLFRNNLEAQPLIDIDAVGAWPLVSATYVLLPRAPQSLERAGRVLNFFYKSFLLGDRAVASTGFAPLPIQTQARIVALLSSFKTTDGRSVPVLSGRSETTRRG